MTSLLPDLPTAEQIEMWLDAFAETSVMLKESSADIARGAWLSFDGWYNAAAVAALAAEMAALSAATQQTAAGAAAQYVAGVAGAMGMVGAPSPLRPFTVIRNGVALSLVHHRPAEAYRRAIAMGADHQTALQRAGLRGAGVMTTDIALQERQAQQLMLDQLGIAHFRRVIRPELSRTGTCGLCIAAADRVYNTGDLMPIHPPSCKCVVMPVMDGADPGAVLNAEDIRLAYQDAVTRGDSTARGALSHLRYQVNEHGELGPVLTKEGDHFRGPGQVALEDDPPRAARMLRKALPVLAEMQSGDVDPSALEYQRDLVERLQRIAA